MESVKRRVSFISVLHDRAGACEGAIVSTSGAHPERRTPQLRRMQQAPGLRLLVRAAAPTSHPTIGLGNAASHARLFFFAARALAAVGVFAIGAATGPRGGAFVQGKSRRICTQEA